MKKQKGELEKKTLGPRDTTVIFSKAKKNKKIKK